MRTDTLLPAAFQSRSFRAWMMFFLRLLLLGRSNGVLAIEEYVVGGALEGAIDHRRVGARNRKVRLAAGAALAGRVKSVAHEGRSSGLKFLVVRPERFYVSS